CERRELIPRVAEWMYNEFCVQDRPAITLDDMEKKLYSRNMNALPFTYVALENDVPVGTVTLYDNDLPGEDFTPWLGSLCVTKECRGKGIGRALIEFAECTARDLGFEMLYLRTEHTDDYYKMLGWTLVKSTLDTAFNLDTRVYRMSLIGSSNMSFLPKRGGMLIKWADILSMREDTLQDTEKSVRGGVPILFPSCGRLDGGKYTYNGREYEMDMHGVARNAAWHVAGTDDKCTVLTLRANDATRAAYPFDFELIYTYTVHEKSLEIAQEVVNHGSESMPFSIGLHPYFAVNRDCAHVAIDAKEYLEVSDNMSHHKFSGVQKLDSATERIMCGLKSNSAVLDTGRGYSVKISGECKYFVIWAPDG
ncbi:MAG: GNAT family N-acetyltransferase, partial [Clostridia bacterium]